MSQRRGGTLPTGRHLVATVLVSSFLTVLAGCSGGTGEESTNPSRTAEDFGSNMARCMTEKGWNVAANPDGSWETVDSIHVSQEERFEADVEECRDRFGYERGAPTMTQEQAEEFYDALLNAAECLKDLGLTTPEAVSKQASVESLINGGPPLWDPYEHVVGSVESAAELEEVFKECPQPGT